MLLQLPKMYQGKVFLVRLTWDLDNDEMEPRDGGSGDENSGNEEEEEEEKGRSGSEPILGTKRKAEDEDTNSKRQLATRKN